MELGRDNWLRNTNRFNNRFKFLTGYYQNFKIHFKMATQNSGSKYQRYQKVSH